MKPAKTWLLTLLSQMLTCAQRHQWCRQIVHQAAFRDAPDLNRSIRAPGRKIVGTKWIPL